ncbi:DUF5110 domain-containing protein [bacterium]|nr:DUF5110 domain-containing protein [bacterium]MBU1677031.1 DUF5110 domain-containing protein [bacterium]
MIRACKTILIAGALTLATHTAAQPLAESVGDGVVRFHASAAARDAALPSLCLVEPLTGTGPAPAGWSVIPEFSRVMGRPAIHVQVTQGTDLYGTGEVPGPLRRNGTSVVAWNFDAYGWDANTPHLYQSHPWVLALRADGTSFGVLADTSHRCRIDLTDGIRFVAQGPEFPVVVVEGGTPQDVVRALGRLTGTMPLPPLWALGYHQCRYSYTPDDRVREVAREFRERHIPCDVVWLDIDYMDDFRCFTFHPLDFPDPVALTDDLHADGFRVISIIDPGIKIDPGYRVYNSGQARDVWVKTLTGRDYVGAVWPGACVFPDFTRADTRDWWADLYVGFLASGIDGVWNDMNEPAVFNVDSKTMPLDNRHRADPELGGSGPHARYHNVYGMLMARATFAGCLRARPDRRPFVLSRANHLGGQRWAACWTGDNTANWAHLDMSIAQVLNLGLSGQPFSGPDIGGFCGAGDGRQFARWMGFGALLPFARGHTGKGNVDKEPWAFGPEVEATCRLALQRRYRLLPHLYTLMREASLSGLPPARPLFFADPADRALRGADDAFLLGDGLLVSCNTSPGASRGAILPDGDWRAFSLVEGDGADLDLPVLMLGAGHILPLGPVVQWSGERPLDELELVVCLDDEGKAEGLLYEDAGEGFGYREGAYRLTRFTAQTREGEVVVSADVVEGNWARSGRMVTVRLLTDGGEVIGTGSEAGPIGVSR